MFCTFLFYLRIDYYYCFPRTRMRKTDCSSILQVSAQWGWHFFFINDDASTRKWRIEMLPCFKPFFLFTDILLLFTKVTQMLWKNATYWCKVLEYENILAIFKGKTFVLLCFHRVLEDNILPVYKWAQINVWERNWGVWRYQTQRQPTYFLLWDLRHSPR
jgi:hypothetical protein